jgi:Ca2+-binding EF-hand superfamily protein
LDDLPPEKKPRVARRGAVTPFALSLDKVEGWQVPGPLAARASKAGHRLRYSLSVSFYHAGSRRFYGNTFVGVSLDEDEENGPDRVIRNDGERRTRDYSSDESRSPPRSSSKNRREKKSSSRSKTRRSKKRRGSGSDGEDVDLTTVHKDLAYFYSSFEDPNCLAVVELVATEFDPKAEVEVGSFGCGWTFIQVFGPTDPEAQTQRDVYRGTPRSLLFFDAGDFQRVGETAVPGCTLSFHLSVFTKLLAARHLIRENEIVGALDVVAGLDVRPQHVPSGAEPVVGPCLGRKIEQGTKGKRKGAYAQMWMPLPARPHLAPAYELRVNGVRIMIPDRLAYEDSMLRSLGQELPSVEIVKSSTGKSFTGLKSTSREVVGSGGNARDLKARVVDRRIKFGLHNGHTLVTPGGWVEARLAETDDDDILALAEGVRSLDLDSYSKHPLTALIVVLEYTVRTKSREASRGASSGARHTDAVAAAQAELQTRALPMIAGMQTFVPFDGKRLRLRNTLRDSGGMDMEMPLIADKRIRIVTSDPVFAGDSNLQDEISIASDGDGIPGLKMAYFDLQCFDSRGRPVKDETPERDEDESDMEPQNWSSLWNARQADEPITSSSDEGTETTVSSSPSSEYEDLRPIVKPDPPKAKPKPKPKRRPARRRSVTPPPPSESTSSESDEDDPPPRRSKWHGVTIEDARRSLIVRSERGAPPPEALLDDYTPTAAVIGGGQGVAAHDLSRASRTRLSRHGFSDVMHDSRMGENLLVNLDPADLTLEISDPLALNEVTFQFASFRAPKASMPLPSSVFFTYQFHTCQPIKTERLFLTPEGGQASRDAPHIAEAPANVPRILIRNTHYGRSEPALAIKHMIDTAALQPYEVEDFAAYLACCTLYIDAWDGDATMLLGTAAVPLRPLLRQGRPVAKIARDYEIVAPAGYGGDDAGVHGAIAIGHGRMAKGPVVGIVQILACNYGEVSSSRRPEALLRAGNMAGQGLQEWRAGSRVGYEGPFHQPRFRVRARPLSAAHPELGEHLAALATSSSSGGRASLMRRSRGAADGEAIGYDELLLLVRRFRGEERGTVRYDGELMKMLRIPRVAILEQRLAKALSRLGGREVEAAFRRFDTEGQGSLSIPQAEALLRTLGIYGEMKADHVRLVLFRIDASGSGLIGLSELLAWMRCHEPKGHSERDAVEARIRRVLTRAETLGTSLFDTFRAFDSSGRGLLSVDEACDALISIGVMHDVNRSETLSLLASMADAHGSISLRAFLAWAGQGESVDSALEAHVRKVLLRAEVKGGPLEEKFGLLDVGGRGLISKREFQTGLSELGIMTLLSSDEQEFLIKKLDAKGDGVISLKDFMSFLGRSWTKTSLLGARLRRILLEAEAEGLNIVAAFGALDRDGSGAIGMDEMYSWIQSAIGQGRLDNPTDVMSLLAEFDTDGDGEVSLPEFMAWLGRGYSGESAVEAKLRRIILKAEVLGNSLEEVFGSLDADGSGQITQAELEDSLRDLGVFSALPSSAVSELLAKLDRDGDGKICLKEFMQWLGRDHSPTAAVEAKLRRILLKAEAQGCSLEAAFHAFDRDGSGQVTLSELEDGLTDLGVFKTLKAAQIKAVLQRFDRDGSGSVSLAEFMAFMGRAYSANDGPLETKVRRIISKAEELGTSPADSFKHFDKDGDGIITEEEMRQGLEDLGIFGALSQEEASQFMKRFSLEGGGGVSVIAFLHFLGREYKTDVGAKLRKVLCKAEELGTPLEVAFAHFDGDGDGRITAAELFDALRRLGQFHNVTKPEIVEFIRTFDEEDSHPSNESSISKSEFFRFVRMSPRSAAARRRSRAEADLSKARRPSRLSIGKEAQAEAAEAEELLRRSLSRVASGTPLSSHFSSFDHDSTGVLDVRMFDMALRSLGITVQDLSRSTAHAAMRGISGSAHPVESVSLKTLSSWLGPLARPLRSRTADQRDDDSDDRQSHLTSKHEELNELRAAIRRAETKGSSLERALAPLDSDGDGFLSIKQLYAGLEDMGVLDAASPAAASEVIDAMTDSAGMIDLVAFIRCMRGQGGFSERCKSTRAPSDTISDELDYTYSADPDTRAAEKKLQRIVALKVRHGVDVESLFRKYDPDRAGVLPRSDFVQVRDIFHFAACLGMLTHGFFNFPLFA